MMFAVRLISSLSVMCVVGTAVPVEAAQPPERGVGELESKDNSAAISFGFWGPTLIVRGEPKPTGFVGSQLSESLAGSTIVLEDIHRYRTRRTLGICTWSAAILLSGLSLAGSIGQVGPFVTEERYVTASAAAVLLSLLGFGIEGTANQFLVRAVDNYNIEARR